MTYDAIRFEIDGPIATITLNRPDRLNACSAQMIDEIADALDHLEGARAVVLTGEGRAFSAGADLQEGGQGGPAGDTIYRRLSRHYSATLLKLARLHMPVITAVNGPAAGMGCSLALCGDLVIASESAFFVQAFVNVGVGPDGGASWLLPRLVGRSRAFEMMMLGERIPARQAVEWGMIYKCVDAADFAAETHALATRIANGPTVAMATMRRQVAAAYGSSLADALLAEAEGQRQLIDTRDAAEGRQAFAEKRKPVFEGR